MADLDAPTRARIERGEVVTSLTTVDGHERARAVGLIAGRPAAVWAVITDYERYREFMPHTKESEVLERRGQVVRFRTRLEFPIRDIWYVIRLELDGKRHRVEWTLEEGNLKANEGSWDLAGYDAKRTLGTYTVAIDPGFYVPRMLLNRATQGSLPKVFEAVRARVAGAT